MFRPRSRRRQVESAALSVAADDLDELHYHLPVGLQSVRNDVLARAVVAAADGAELDAGDAGALEVDDVARAVAADARGGPAELAGGGRWGGG